MIGRSTAPSEPDLIDAFASRGIAVSGGSACHAGDPSPSRVLVEMGIDPDLAAGAVRFSMGRATTQTDLAAVDDVLRTGLDLEDVSP